MSMINKVPASAGAQWLLDGLGALRRAPGGLPAVAMGGVLIFILAVMLGLVVMLAGQLLPWPLSLIPELANSLLTAGTSTFVFAGVLYAVREVAFKRPAKQSALLHGFEHPRSLLLVTMAPVAAGIVMSLLLVALVGQDAERFAQVYTQLQQAAAAGTPQDPKELQAVLMQLPLLRLFAWVFLACLLTAVTSCVMMLAVPLVVFGGLDGISALRTAVRGCIHNLAAMLFYIVLAIALYFAAAILVQFLAALLQFLFGPALAVVMAGLVLHVVAVPVLAAGAYSAYHQIFEPLSEATSSASPSTFAA